MKEIIKSTKNKIKHMSKLTEEQFYDLLKDQSQEIKDLAQRLMTPSKPKTDEGWFYVMTLVDKYKISMD